MTTIADMLCIMFRIVTCVLYNNAGRGASVTNVYSHPGQYLHASSISISGEILASKITCSIIPPLFITMFKPRNESEGSCMHYDNLFSDWILELL